MLRTVDPCYWELQLGWYAPEWILGNVIILKTLIFKQGYQCLTFLLFISLWLWVRRSLLGSGVIDSRSRFSAVGERGWSTALISSLLANSVLQQADHPHHQQRCLPWLLGNVPLGWWQAKGWRWRACQPPTQTLLVGFVTHSTQLPLPQEIIFCHFVSLPIWQNLHNSLCSKEFADVSNHWWWLRADPCCLLSFRTGFSFPFW